MGNQYSFRWLPDSQDHLREFPKVAQTTVVKAVLQQLQNQPTEETRHRKKLRPNHLASWELRVGDFRVYYEVIEDDQVVEIVAVGQKSHNTLRIGGEEIEL